MPIAADGHLHLYFVNVGQGDTTIIVTPGGRVLIIDATRAGKIVNLLSDLNVVPGDTIDLLVITHPHADHYSGAGRLIDDYHVLQAVLSPFWHGVGMGPLGYRLLVADLFNRRIRCQFLSGYARFYPDYFGGAVPPPNGLNGELCLELLGPSNGLLTSLDEQGLLDTNHLSIVSRISCYGRGAVIAADAQMENWATFDSERMAGDDVRLLRAAHHGSGNGTQWERLKRLRPRGVVVSSDLNAGHGLPDVTGSAVFARYSSNGVIQPLVALTGESGTIEYDLNQAGAETFYHFSDASAQNVNLGNRAVLTRNTNPTDWKTILLNKAAAL